MMELLPTVIKVVAFGALALVAIASAWATARIESDGHGRDGRDREALDSARGEMRTDGGTVLEEATDKEVREAIEEVSE